MFARNIWAQPQELLYCYCDKTIEKFHALAGKEYGSLDALNKAWVRRYSKWQEIDPPRAMGTYLDWIDWRDYIIDRSTWEMKFRVSTIAAADPHHILESHGAYHPPIDGVAVGGTNGWRLAEVVQIWGLSNFPRVGAAFLITSARPRFEITRSNAAGKPFWMTELQGGHGSSGLHQSPAHAAAGHPPVELAGGGGRRQGSHLLGLSRRGHRHRSHRIRLGGSRRRARRTACWRPQKTIS